MQTQVETPVVVAYLLIQDNNILDVCNDPSKLNFELLNEYFDWRIYAGCKNEFGQKEIAGIVAKVWCTNSYSNYVITAKCSQYDIKIACAASEPPSTIIAAQLQRMYRQKQLSDPTNLGGICLFAM